MVRHVDLGTQASLIIATFELSAVRLIRGAMLAADIASGRGQPASGLGPAPNPDIAPRRTIEPTPVNEPRERIRPAPRVEPRAVLYSACPGTTPAAVPCTCPDLRVEPAIEASSPAKSPFPPVWKTLPPVENPAPPRRPIKLIRHYPDIHHKGILVDVHV